MAAITGSPSQPEAPEKEGPTALSSSGRSKSVVRVAARAVFAVVALVLLALAVGPMVYPFQTFYVRTGSMVPSIQVGSLVVATRSLAADLAVGDVIVFKRPGGRGEMVVHRIVKVESSSGGQVFVTKGDANAAADDWRVPATGIGWRYVTSLPHAGFVVGWMHIALSRRGWLGALAIGAAVWALISIWQSPDTKASPTGSP